MSVAEILSSSRIRIELGLRKHVAPSFRYAAGYSQVNAFNLAILAKIAYWETSKHIHDFLFAGAKSNSHGIGLLDAGNVKHVFLDAIDSDIENIKPTFKFEEDKGTDTQFFHYRTSEYLVFSFRGTAGGKDIAMDGKSTLEPFSEGVGRVHQGFLTAFRAVVKVIDAAVMSGPGLPVFLTGHSLGGALATVAAAYMRHKYQRKVMVYTFGSPRVGDSVFAHHFTKVEPFIYYRCVHHKDLVPMVPPPYTNLRLSKLTTPGIGWISAVFDPFGKPFTHIGKKVWIRRLPDNYVSVEVDKKDSAWHRVTGASAGIKESRPKWDQLLGGRIFSVNDHFMENYVAILGSDLRCNLRTYLDSSSKASQSQAKALVEYLEDEIHLLRCERDKLILTHPALADATAVGGVTHPDQLTPQEHFDLLTKVLNDKQFELTLAQARLTRVTSPTFAASLLHDIIGAPLTPALKREMEYQAKHIAY